MNALNAYSNACLVEQRAMNDIIPFLKIISHDERYVLTNKGNLSKELQKMVGDGVTSQTLKKLLSITDTWNATRASSSYSYYKLATLPRLCRYSWEIFRPRNPYYLIVSKVPE